MAKVEKKSPRPVEEGGPIRVKALTTVFYDDALRMPGSIFDIRFERHFNKRSMKKVDPETRLSTSRVSDTHKNAPPSAAPSEADQELAEERQAAEDEARAEDEAKWAEQREKKAAGKPAKPDTETVI